MIKLQENPSSHLVIAYNQMMEVMRNAYEHSKDDSMTLQKAVNRARQQAVDTGAVTVDEAYEIGEYIKRDINDAAEHMMESSNEFHDWLMLDIEVIERKVIDLFLSVADHTRIELENFSQRNTEAETDSRYAAVYRSGEVTGPGTLICEYCGEIKPFLSSDHISDCTRCGHDAFIRRRSSNNRDRP